MERGEDPSRIANPVNLFLSISVVYAFTTETVKVS
jgi:hypothetical protein